MASPPIPPERRTSWRALAVAILGSFAAYGCAQIIGASDDRELYPLGYDGDGGGDPDIASVPKPSDGCPAGEKRCNGACVPKSVEYGCGAADCSPCSLANAERIICKDDQCTAVECKTGFGACGEPSEGCNADLASPRTCTNCLTSCNVDAGQVCAPGGCGGSCGALTNCNGSCVDRNTSPNNCGTCGNVCPQGANGDATCNAGSCVVTCRAGFGHCDGNPTGPCTAMPLFYRDADGDGYGDTGNTKQACNAAQAGGGWVAAAGDCHDGNGAVHPGQAQLFGNAYQAVSGVLSYDYDCNGTEEDPGAPHFTPCLQACDGYGYIPARSGRSGVGVNDYCGSTTIKECQGGSGSGGEIPSLPPGYEKSLLPVSGCTGYASPAPANGCH